MYADLVDADPPPRELTPVVRRYIAAQAPYAWVVIAVVLGVFPAAIAAAAVASPITLGWLAVTVVGVVALGAWTSARRARVRKVIVHGEQRPARIGRVAHLVLRRGVATARRVTMMVEVDGRRARCVSWTGDLDDAEGGAMIRVLVHPGVDFVVPVVSVT